MSNDSFSEVTEESWFGRLGAAIKGVLLGIVLFGVSFPLLWWNEGRAVKMAQGLKELGGSVVSLSADRVDPQNDQKPVHMTAEATTDEILNDPEFGVSAKAIQLQRKAEMYQWNQEEKTETTKKIGGGEERKTTYSYERTWANRPIKSDEFKQPEGHANPGSMRFSNHNQSAQTVKFGAFKLPLGLVAQMTNYEPLPLGPAELEPLPPELKNGAKVDAGILYLPVDGAKAVVDPQDPRVGDLRISFQTVKPGTVSIIARQLGDSFEPWRSRTGTAFERLMPGTASSEAMVGQMEQENTLLTWGLRALGFALMAAGIGSIFRPLVVVADVLPILGDLLRMGLGLFAGIVAACLSLATIGVAWIAYRPVLGVGLIVTAVVLIAGFKMLGAKRRSKLAAEPA